jgi:hypothetical protein
MTMVRKRDEIDFFPKRTAIQDVGGETEANVSP